MTFSIKTTSIAAAQAERRCVGDVKAFGTKLQPQRLAQDY
jgi:hypothetical protein